MKREGVRRVAVLFDTAGFVRSLPLTGAAARTLYLNKHLAQQGIEIRLYLCDLNPQSRPSDNWPFQTDYLPYESVYSDPQSLIPPMKSFSPDVLVMSNSQLTAHYGRDLADAVGASLVYEMHDVEKDLLTSIQRPDAECAEAGSFQAKAAAVADGVVAMSPEDAREARALTSSPVMVVPCGVEPSGGTTRRPQRRELAFVGNLYYEPNLRAVRYLQSPQFSRMLAEQHLAVEVYGRYPSELRDPTAPGVRLQGPVPDLHTALLSASVGLAPLDSGSGMKLKVLEYINAGMPVVGTAFAASGFADFERFGLLGRDDLSDFPELVERLLRDERLRARLGDEGRKLAETRYSWSRLAEQVREAYDFIRSGHRPRLQRPSDFSSSAIELPYWLREWNAREQAADQAAQASADSMAEVEFDPPTAEAIDCARLAASSASGLEFPKHGDIGYKGRSAIFMSEDAVLKVFTHRGDDRNKRERAGAAAATKCSSFEVPEVVNFSSPPGALSWLVCRRIIGEPIRSGEVDMPSLARDFGRLAAELHACGPLDPGALPEFERSRGSRLPDANAEPDDDSCRLGLVHGDLSLRNLLVRDGRLVGVVDFERSGAGCAYHDLATVYLHDVMLGNLPGDEFLASYRDVSAALGGPSSIDMGHLKRHLLDYCNWILVWAPGVDTALADSIRGLRLEIAGWGRA